ncbi:TIGR02117 family protein [Neisseriaceae bacterium B1]
MKRILKCLGKITLGFIAIILFYGLTAWILGQQHIESETISEPSIDIYLMNNGVHTDIVMPLQNPTFNWLDYANPSDTPSGSSNARYIAIGWGDKGFYLNTPRWRDLTASTAIRAISGFNQTALHVIFYPQIVENERVVKIQISQAQYQRLAQNIAQDFQRNAHSSVVIQGAHYQDNDAFYEAHGRYSLFYTCNTWSNQKLKNSGIGGVWWTPFAQPLLQRFQAAYNPK